MIPGLGPVVSYDQKHVAHHFDHLDLRNAIAPLMVLSTSHAANTNVSGIM